MAQHYELLFIISVKVEESNMKAIVKKVEDSITQNGGQITKLDNWGNRKLAYEINHEKNGTYVLVEFDMETDKVNELSKKFKLMKEILRHAVVKKRIKTEKEVAREKRISEKIKEARISEEKEDKEPKEVKEEPLTTKKKKDKGPKISLEDLDKKLDEILKEEV